MMDWYGGGIGWGGWLMMVFAMVAFWAVVAFVVVALFRNMGRSSEGHARGERDAMKILDERFARGEIDQEEFQARRQALRDADRGRTA